MSKKINSFLFIILSIAGLSNKSTAQITILTPLSYKHYIDSFNADDIERYPQYIPDNKSWEFLANNIPLLDCPDEMIEQTYYFRWWTYRKHIKKTPAGFVISEFLPDVPWAGKYNTINCAAALHIYEGRWLHEQKYVNDYEKFWFTGGGDVRVYSSWITDAIFNQFKVTHDASLAKELLPYLIKNYHAWEKERLDANGLFWQIDGKDGMEVSICGSGYRPTINSYMYGNAMAIAEIALLLHQKNIADEFKAKADVIKENLQNELWDDSDEFFKVLPRGKDTKICTTRELLGYTPWYFNIPDEKYSIAWKFLMSPRYFYAPYGPTTAEQDAPGFRVSYEGAACQWNGPSWPFATSITLTALANVLNNYIQQYITKADYFKLFSIYTNSQQRTRKDGKIIPWIDEDLNPYTGDWIARTCMQAMPIGEADKYGGPNRGKDYNHSTYCDLVITGLIGIRPRQDNILEINPLVPASWKYFCLDNVLYHGQLLTVLYDRTGERYHKGKGFFIFINGRKVASSASIKRIRLAINK